MTNNNNDPGADLEDGIAVLFGLGVLAVVGVGVLKVLKAIAEKEPNQTITNEAATVAATYTSNYEREPNCHIHGMYADLCENCNRCMDCVGRDDDQFCVDCWYDGDD